MPSKFKRLLTLFSVFFRIGAFTFGGGYAMIPLIQKEVVENKKWASDDDLLEIIAIAESTPGPIAINTATFIGYRVAGFFGSFFATFGVVLPSFLIIFFLSFVLREFGDNRYVVYAFKGIRAGVLALIIKALYTMYRQIPKNAFSYVLMGLVFVLTAFLKVDAFYCLIGCAVCGVISSLIAKRRSKQ